LNKGGNGNSAGKIFGAAITAPGDTKPSDATVCLDRI